MCVIVLQMCARMYILHIDANANMQKLLLFISNNLHSLNLSLNATFNVICVNKIQPKMCCFDCEMASKHS